LWHLEAFELVPAASLPRLWIGLFTLVLVAGQAGATPWEIRGQVVGIADGDSITVLTADKKQYKVRLAGIDAPEQAQPFGQRSKQSLSDLVFRKEVRVEVHAKDRYTRQVGIVYEGSININQQQVARGLAWAYRQYLGKLPKPFAKALLDSEAQARSDKRGLWVDRSPTPPWQWRRQKRNESR
jgi:endonuclease YncB( thermonuclease family)